MQRTDQQNKSIHLFCDLLAEALNDAGHTLNDKVVIKADIDFTKENVKEQIWKPVQQAMYPDKTSTTQLTTGEVSKVYEQINRFIAERAGVSVPFPSEDEQ